MSTRRMRPPMDTPIPNDLGAFWMPFSANRQFKAAPRLLTGAKDMHYRSANGRKILDGTAGLWCVNAGHGRPEITKAIQDQAGEMDYAPPFQMGHPKAFELAARLTAMAPDPLNHAFFTNSGSEAVDTALKIALAYHSRSGAPGRRRLIGRARGYHGAGFGGISVGGISPNRTNFGGLLPEVDHLAHTHNLEQNAFSRGQPDWGGHLAEELNDLVALHGPGAIAAVIVEPMAGSTGVLVPPKGYLERLRAICDAHGILLIFDEVITGFGRLGASFAAARFGVTPDIMTLAKGLTNAAVPMGAVLVSGEIFDTFMDGPDNIIELFHGYTYSSHPLACAAGLATLALYEKENLFERAASLESYWQSAVHGLQGLENVIDIRDIGLTAGIEMAPRDGAPGMRGYEALVACFEAGALVRVTGDTIALSPPLIIAETQIDELLTIVASAIENIS
ncbi:MAG: aspartate aminotransferase family protein [Rhodospirillaceae bacterium]|nr:aspartate aminotransferase family protein [Rhodospirillaceae bacterium]MBT5839092.1 aspartate aminotransferase family protein [Rhodospirillaceae bacterium]MBT6291502.1 aspartate aminotransferase family protein [Rhodospirillaceae bacterium]MBT7031246.1 aspartate aminotransferase family protein [Rhodospirillaceae bacterium]MBT7568543.1 aspartate aminotransferase family protein [Rhodospirillaceae bacterium]